MDKCTYWECLKKGEAKLSSAGIEEAANDAWVLFSEVFQMSRARYYMDRTKLCDASRLAQYNEWINLRAKRIPLQHITGYAPFMGYEFFVNENVLTPRADTEVLVEQAFAVIIQQYQSARMSNQQSEEKSGFQVNRKKESIRVLDMCTGSGCIAVSLACMAQEAGIGCEIMAADLSKEALAVAEKNNCNLCDGRVELICSNLFEALPDRQEFDIIVSNPPYIKSGEIDGLMPEVRDHEPRMALDGKGDGLYFYRKIAEDGRRFLRDGGTILFEIGYDQGKMVPEILENNGYKQICLIKDLAGLDRVVTACKEMSGAKICAWPDVT